MMKSNGGSGRVTILLACVGFAWIVGVRAADVHSVPAAIAGMQAGTANARLSVWDGAYAEDQAERGKAEYEYNCAPCHIHDLTGDPIADTPALAGDEFLTQWDGKTVKDLLEYMKTNMPPDSRGSLEANTYADIAAFVLQFNKLPAGKEPLGSDEARLGRTFIEKEKKK